MKPVIASRRIYAPLNVVFQTISDPRNFQEAVPHITGVEFLSEHHRGVGTRFRETRSMNGRESSVILEVTEFVENERVRLVSDAGGTVWDTVFTVAAHSGGMVELRMQMDVLPKTWKARIMSRLIWRFVAKSVESDMDAIKAHCEP